MTARTLIAMILAAALLAACGGYREPAPIPPRLGDENIKVGIPYKVAGVTYYPRVDHSYDVTGYASWYGRDFHGKRTANGERYDMNQLTAAHTTLPMPSYVRITNLSNGRSLVLRINDRGPFVANRIIDVSRRAAQLLGFESKGVQRVRVQAVRPDGTPYPRLVDGGLIPAPRRTAEMDIEERPLDNPDPEPVLIDEGFEIFIQVASFSLEENANTLAGQLQGVGPVMIQKAEVNNTWFYRVRVGAYALMEEALEALERVKNLGFLDAHIFTDPAG